MDFAILPPEVNSARMYTGPGSGSLMAAAGSWDSLANELITTAKIYESVVSGLTTLSWHGPASEAMTAATAPYVDWLYTTAEQTKQTAMQARAAAAAFEHAFAMTVPPPAIASNRTQLMSLIATNFFGQNTAAIAATEAQYAEMWAQDASAMYGYASSSAAATMLTPFTPPQQTTSTAGVAAQSDAVAHAGTSVSSTLQQLATGSTPQCLQDICKAIESLFGTYGFELNAPVWGDLSSTGIFLLPAQIDIASIADAAAKPAAAAAGATGTGFADAISGAVVTPVNAVSGLSGGGGAVSAVLTEAKSIGTLSVPQSWATPAVSRVSGLSGAGLTTLSGTDEAVGSGMPGVPGMPAGTLARASGVVPRYGVRLTVMPRPPAAG